jgi:hypothetical protein
MRERPAEEDDDPRPRVTGFFVEPDEAGTPLAIAIGRAVVAAAALEKTLQLELARLLYIEHAGSGTEPDSTLAHDLSRLDNFTAGRLLKELRRLGLPTDLDKRIGDAVRRRNDVVHRTFEDPELARATTGRGNVDLVVDRIERLALDCGELAVELEMFAIPKLRELTGKSHVDLIDLVKAVDASTITDPRERKQLEAVQAFAELEDLSAVLEALGISERPDKADPPAPTG